MTASVHLPAARHTAVLGLIQILSWGGSFYLLSVLATPIVTDTGWSAQWVYGGLSLAIALSGLLSPRIGLAIAAGHGRRVLAASGPLMACGLLLLALSHALPLYLLAWCLLGIGMAMGLYDPLFATMGTLYGAAARRAISGITLISGFCTSLVWPATALFLHWGGWRGGCLIWAAILLLCVLPATLWALPPAAPRQRVPPLRAPPPADIAPALFWLLSAIFTLASVVMTAVSLQLIALLQAGGYGLSAALALAAIPGPCQVAARVLDRLFHQHHPLWATGFSVGLVASGLAVLALFPGAAALSMLLYGAGNGLRAIVRGTLPLALVSQPQYARVMGRIARPALLGQALTPLAVGALLTYGSASLLLVLLTVLSVVNLLLVWRLQRYLARRPRADECPTGCDAAPDSAGIARRTTAAPPAPAPRQRSRPAPSADED
ncbi:MFS transporter [Pantoea sp. 1.19]|uniref:MFS transporter n=1 Tax=Pantoea sp. 1.19 TaxID=1925589 RepID=UPI001F0A6B49|nr:MFS transporter [Pantoea sp. 1.19]